MKRFEFNWGNYVMDRYLNIYLLPVLCYTVDRQLADLDIDPEISRSISLSWGIWYIEIVLNTQK